MYYYNFFLKFLNFFLIFLFPIIKKQKTFRSLSYIFEYVIQKFGEKGIIEGSFIDLGSVIKQKNIKNLINYTNKTNKKRESEGESSLLQ